MLVALMLLLGASAVVSEAVVAPGMSAPRENGRYQNPYMPVPAGGPARYWLSRLSGEVAWAVFDPEEYQVPTAAPMIDHTPLDNPQITWIGQATVLIQHRGVAMLTDPVFSPRASPLQLFGPRRIAAPGLSLDELPRIDIVVLSHDHYDHLDRASIEALRDARLFVVPLGIDRWLRRIGIAPEKIIALDWWHGYRVQVGGVEFSVTATPAQHVSGRGIFDRNKRLWATWALQIDDFSVFFAGDTGYNPVQFKAIGQRLGPFDLAVLPIGSYGPRHLMQGVHMDPADAVMMHEDVRAERSLAIHWGTFFLTAEHPREPPLKLAEATAARNYPYGEFAVFAIGETRRIPLAKGPADCLEAGPYWCFQGQRVSSGG